MLYHLSLTSVGIAVGTLLLASHLLALANAKDCMAWLKSFPRSRAAGTVLLAIAAIWSFRLVQTMDLGEFSNMRTSMLVVIAVGAFLSWKYVEDFLAVRSLGMLALLAADPILDAAYLKDEPTRLFLVVLAYVWIVLGLFWVGMPWLLRDQIDWLTRNAARWKMAAIGGSVYGLLLLAFAFTRWA
jgi:hypothetical protein